MTRTSTPSTSLGWPSQSLSAWHKTLSILHITEQTFRVRFSTASQPGVVIQEAVGSGMTFETSPWPSMTVQVVHVLNLKSSEGPYNWECRGGGHMYSYICIYSFDCLYIVLAVDLLYLFVFVCVCLFLCLFDLFYFWFMIVTLFLLS